MKRREMNGLMASTWPEWRKGIKINAILLSYRRKRPNGDEIKMALADGAIVMRDGHIDLP